MLFYRFPSGPSSSRLIYKSRYIDNNILARFRNFGGVRLEDVVLVREDPLGGIYYIIATTIFNMYIYIYT